MLIHGGDLRLGIDHRPESYPPTINIIPNRLFYEQGWQLIGQSPGRRENWSISVADIASVEAIAPDLLAMEPPAAPSSNGEGFDAVIRLEFSRVSHLLSTGWPVRSRVERPSDSRVDITVAVPDAATLVDWVITQGDGVELRWPPQIRHGFAKRPSGLSLATSQTSRGPSSESLTMPGTNAPDQRRLGSDRGFRGVDG